MAANLIAYALRAVARSPRPTPADLARVRAASRFVARQRPVVDIVI